MENIPDDASTDNQATQFFDCAEHVKAFHLSIDYQTLEQHEQGQQSRVMFTRHDVVDDLLNNMDWSELTGKYESYSSLICAVSISSKFQRLEEIQPMLEWKPLEVIKITLEVTTQ